MADEEGEEPQWIKRIRWAKSGLPSVDDRINLLASLYIEGTVNVLELNPEAIEALKTLTANPTFDREVRLDDFANRVRGAAQWIALYQVIHFCSEHNLTSIEERSKAFQLFDEDLNAMGAMLGSTDLSWIANACEFRSQTVEVADPMHRLIKRWAIGEGIADNADLIEQSMSLQSDIGRRRRPNLDAPEDAVINWTNALRASVQGLVLRETDLYCRAAGLNTPEERTKAWRDMLATLQKPTPGHSK